jgi:hypothetical protein
MSYVVDAQRSPEVMQRADFPFLLNARGITTLGIEIGVNRGDFATEILTHWTGKTLIGCDNWEPYQDMPWERDVDYLCAVTALAPFGTRVQLIRTTSLALNAECRQTGQVPEFVYLDADHSYDAVQADIAMWWPLLPPHGILAGHDFDHEHLGVRKAVEQFAAQLQRRILYSWSGNEPGSWYFYREEPLSMIDVRGHSLR